MQRFILALSLLLCSTFSGVHAVNSSSSLQWFDSYDKGLSASKSSGKPLILFFTGSDWCGWCQKLENEVLNQPEFAQAVGDKFVFVVLDFPMKKPVDPSLSAQNKQLQNQYNVKGFPTLVILDDQQNLIGTTGYRPGGPKAYADYLFKMVNDFGSYKKKFDSLNQNPSAVNSGQLKDLLGKAKELCRPEDANKILSIGIQSQDNRFFLMERYRILAERGQIESAEALQIKKELISLDPENKHLTQYEIAVINFENFSDMLEMENISPELVVAPLTNYIEKFGGQDKQNLWRLQMLISQIFLEKNQLNKALDYAIASYETAPSSVQPDIAIAIKTMQSQLLTCNP